MQLCAITHKNWFVKLKSLLIFHRQNKINQKNPTDSRNPLYGDSIKEVLKRELVIYYPSELGTQPFWETALFIQYS